MASLSKVFNYIVTQGISVANINKSDEETCCNCTYDGVYLVNGPEYYDKQGNSIGKMMLMGRTRE